MSRGRYEFLFSLLVSINSRIDNLVSEIHNAGLESGEATGIDVEVENIGLQTASERLKGPQGQKGQHQLCFRS